LPERRHIDPLHLGTDEHPYSKGLMARALMRAGVSVERAYELARRIEQDLGARSERTANIDRIQELAADVLGETDGGLAIGRLRRYQDLDELDLPLIILIGGATGTGKSTIAAEVAYRLGITRVTSTDFVRQTMRALFTPEFLPAIHYSSFDAGRALPTMQEEEVDPLLHGFLEQTRHVLVGVQAVWTALEPARDALMELSPPPLGERPVGGLLDQHVLEPELGLGPAPALADQVEPLELEQRAPDVAVAARDRLEEREAELSAQHRRRHQRVVRVGLEPVDPGEDHPLDRRRDLDLDLVVEPPSLTLAHERARVHERPDELLEEERVALGVLEDPSLHVVGQRAGPDQRPE